MTITLYDDQHEVLQLVRRAFSGGHQTVILQSPTGSGKSRMGAYMAAGAIKKGSNVLFDVPMRELRSQISGTFSQLGIEHSHIASGFKFNPFSRCWVSTTPTIANRIDRIPKIDFALIDEGHQGGAARDLLKETLRNMGAKILILTATPERLDGKSIDSTCDSLVMGKSVRWLIDNKRLSDYRLFTPTQPDLSSLRVTASGEYNQQDVSGFMESQNVITGDAVRHYKKFAMGKRNVIYCTSIRHSQLVCQAFNDAGIPTAHIDGTMSDDERKTIIKAYARRELHCVTNSDLLLYGFDLAASSGYSDAVIEAISDLKPTMSKAMQKQKDGRGLRYKPDPLILMSHAGNHFGPDGQAKHGLPCSEVEWQWKGRKKSVSASERTISVRSCPMCYFCHRPSELCPSCGYRYEVKSRILEEVEGDLIEITRDQLQNVKKQERMLQGKAQTLPELMELGKRRGVKNPAYWAKKVMEGRRKS